ncbi:SMI1/KNR4 family protein [Aquimarina mytili]|uniref:SMI1/KNR4 family protein n=1 Tax=Aquimarina mytili TaxID=874423 RepID=A0A936ZQB1_9FLAO|nr:SMI1/KNR4 family protein [Aquimarina mytili]MBL0682743.1 SMI1/KNR4 family protein [Aquimarina mytili]
MKNYYELKTDTEHKFWEYELKGKNFKMKWGLVEDYYDRSETQSKITKYDSPEHGEERVSLMIQRYEKKGYVTATKPKKNKPKKLSTSSGTTEFDAIALKNTLQTLDKFLQKKRPEYYEQFNPPLEIETIQVLEEKYGVTIPEDLKLVYLWKNGQSRTCSKTFVNNSMFIPLEEMLATQQEFTSMIVKDFEAKNWWNKHWFPIFHNGGGDHICYDTEGTFTGQKGQLLEFWHDESDRNIICSNLVSLFKNLNKFYDTTDIHKIDEFIDISNYLDY